MIEAFDGLSILSVYTEFDRFCIYQVVVVYISVSCREGSTILNIVNGLPLTLGDYPSFLNTISGEKESHSVFILQYHSIQAIYLSLDAI